ncbi:uncharacterized protein LOC128329802 isoform X3 [Hemicordylus capensis]|nr:uncharacterized protein LOC128329802 isoform X3 [Hemicordylus capensis]XP_053117503.1 uncharacterized protein LOC128329802 isoform X3 [Hemicordylus capensis]XP_053117504.1 uncharacterized protein LOC128329802 isoform X3 [Hemicordylus capensis]
MSIRDDEMSNLLDIPQDMENVVQAPRSGRATFSLSKGSDPYLIPKDEVLTSQAVRNTVSDGIGQRSDDNIVDLTNTQDGLRNLTESALEEEPEPAPARLSRLKRKAKSKDVVSHEQHQPGHMAPRDSDVEVQPAYKKTRKAILEPEHEPGVRDVQELNAQDNEFLASMARVTEHIETLIRTRAVAFERKAEAEQHLEQAKRIIRKQMAVISDTSQQLECLKTCANPVCDFVDRNKKDQPYPVCIQVGGGSTSNHQPGGYRNASDSSDEFEPSEESPSGPGPQNAFTEQCETQNGSSLGEASDVGPNATPKERATHSGASRGGLAFDVGPAAGSQQFSSEEAAGISEETPPVDLQFIQRYNRSYACFNGTEMYYEFKFVNLDRVHSFCDALSGMHSAIQRVLDNINNHIEPGDFVQLRLRAPGISNPLYSARRQAGHLNAEAFLSAISNLLQSYAQILADGVLTLAVIVITPPRGAGRRHIKSIPYSSIIQKKRLHLIDVPMPNTALCFAASLMAVLDLRATATQIKKGAKKLYQDLGWSEQKQVSYADVETVETHMKVNIVVVQWGTSGWSILKTPEQKYLKTCFLLLHKDHYYGVKNIKGFFGTRNFFYVCYTPYRHTHDCLMRCHRCLEAGCVKHVGRVIRCPKCKMQCRSHECLGKHMKLAAVGRVECIPRDLCEKCFRYVELGHETERICRGKQCRVCYEYLSPGVEHACYIPRLQYPEISVKYVFYDCECRQEDGVHVPNYIYAKAFEGETVEPVKAYQEKQKDWEKWGPQGDYWEFKGDKCLNEFVLRFTSDNKFMGCTFLAHNSRSYDGILILRELINEGLDVELLTQGGKLLCITVTKNDIKFIDSLCHLPMALAKLPKAMGFQGCKGYFPHFFNKKENESYVGNMPDPQDYGVDAMKPADREEFMKWYEENKSKTFDMQKELAYYCQKDVDILMQACTKYRHELVEMTWDVVDKPMGRKNARVLVGIDPFQYPTLASVCLRMYRYKYLKDEEIAIPAPDNYHHQCKRFSTMSIQWLEYIAHRENIHIQHALKGGEFKVDIPQELQEASGGVKAYYLDGYSVNGGKKCAFEFNGCFYHGCVTCYSAHKQHPMLSETYGFLYNASERKADVLKRMGFEVRCIWEHEWRDMVKGDQKVVDFLKQQGFPEPLEPRDALFGGRTGCVSLYYEAKEGEQIHYSDFTSLYPFIMRNRQFPIGHPKVIYDDFRPLSEYFGIAKVKVYPPRRLFFPVLPVKVNGKLMFPLCSLCADSQQLEQCRHNDEERALVGTWCTVELNVAVAKGYRVAQIYEVWHFERSSGSLFSEYVKTFLRQKQEASGYPAEYVSREDREKYIAEYYKKEGVCLRPEMIESNPAKRQIAKLFLNSLWGKFAQRSNLPRTSIVKSPNELFQYLFSDSYEVSMCEFLDDDTCCVSWKDAKERIVPPGHTNVFLACFTTAYARLHLYSIMEKLGERCLYHDTDSVIYVSREGEYNPPLGNFLGELTNELPADQYITEFVSTGPKSYGYKLSGGESCIKVKGITLNFSNCQKINFDSLKNLVFAYVSDRNPPREIVVEQNGIVRNKRRWEIETRLLRKTQRVVFDKRVIVEGFKTIPYGY